jgi:hypothetical protein
MNMKMNAFWDAAQCSLVEAGRRRSDDGGSKLWNVGQFLPDYIAQHPTRQISVYIVKLPRQIYFKRKL